MPSKGPARPAGRSLTTDTPWAPGEASPLPPGVHPQTNSIQLDGLLLRLAIGLVASNHASREFPPQERLIGHERRCGRGKTTLDTAP